MPSQTSSAEVAARKNIDAIERHEPRVRAWVERDESWALAEAGRIDRSDSSTILGGRLIGVKDIIDVEGFSTRCGSPIYANHKAPRDLVAASLIRKAGGVILGKTTTTEFAYFAPAATTNPHNKSFTPGGSSSGSAAAVAAGMVSIALGTQTAASITRPASFCGVVGFKPSFGSYSLVGVKTLAHSLDTLGILAASVEDVALMHGVLSRAAPVVVEKRRPRIGVCRTGSWSLATSDTAAALDSAAEVLRQAGVEVREISLPGDFTDLAELQASIMAYDAARDLAYEHLVHGDRISPQISALIARGLAVSQESHFIEQRRASLARARVPELFRDIDVIMAPAAPGEAPAGLDATGDPIFNRMWTLLQLPTICLPGFESAKHLPIGVQFLAPLYSDWSLLGYAAWIEATFAHLRPSYLEMLG